MIWIDCEMTGLDVTKDKIIEISALVTDAQLNILGEGIDLVINASEQDLAGMDDFVTNMHTSSGLINEVRESKLSVQEAESMVLDYLKQFVEPGVAPLAGNSVGMDRKFIDQYMPELSKFLHYRTIDVSTIKELCRRWFPRIFYGKPDKALAHRALSDIKESIYELAFYRKAAFVSEPGPSSEDIENIVKELNDQSGSI